MSTYKLWAKTDPFHPLYRHMIDSGVICKELLENSSLSPLKYRLEQLLATDDIVDTVSFITAIHDIGKCHPYFQCQSKDPKHPCGLPMPDGIATRKYRHESGTVYFAEEIWKQPDLDENAIQLITCALGLHHEKTPNYAKIKKEYDPTAWKMCQQELYHMVFDIFKPNLKLLNHCTNLDTLGVLLWGIVILSDWISSSEVSFSEIDLAMSPQAYFEAVSQKASEVIIARGLGVGKKLPTLPFAQLFSHLNISQIRPLQKSCIEIVNQWKESCDYPLLTILEAPMGEGKTESAVFLATHLAQHYKKSGIYFALPTSGSSNQMVERISDLLHAHDMDKARLLHSTAWLMDDHTHNIQHENGAEISAFTAPLRRGLLSQYAVGTVDQIMMSVMNIRFGVLRLIGASSKVIIIDEVHAYDTYMFTIIKRLLEWCKVLCIPVVLLSATLPSGRKQDILSIYAKTSIQADYPLITYAGDRGVQQEIVKGTSMQNTVRLSIMPILDDMDAMAKFVAEKAGDGAVCVVMNTVNEAVTLYKAVKAITDAQVILFHARFTVKRRNQIEQHCLQEYGKANTSKRNTILIATQVVEQSLDIDFDTMISAIAPMDLLLQRMGRLHRHDRERPPKYAKPAFTVLVKENQTKKTPSEYVYSPYILEKTMDAIKDVDEIHLPQDIRSLVENVYAEDAGDEAYTKLLFGEQIQELLGYKACFPSPNKKYFFRAENSIDFFDESDEIISKSSISTRLGEPSIRIALVDEREICADLLLRPCRELAKKILLETISVRKSMISFVNDAIKCGGLLSSVLVLPTQNDRYTCMSEGKHICMYHDNELGLQIERE